MSKKYMKDIVNIFIFRRDFRIVDNTALTLLKKSYPEYDILPVFIFNPKQIDKSVNPYYSVPSVEFMIESLSNLNSYLDSKLCYLYGEDIEVLSKLLKNVSINCIAFNTDFTPFAKKRDESVRQWCDSNKIPVITYNDYVLYDFKIKTDSGKDYEVYTPFYRKCIANLKLVPHPTKDTKDIRAKIYTAKIQGSIKNIGKFIDGITPQRDLKGGRDEAFHIISKIRSGFFAKYDKERDYPSMNKTTKLSPYLKFGCVSIREVFWECINAYGPSHGLVRELIWREFYANVTNNIPHVLEGQIRNKGLNYPMKLKYKDIEWPQNDINFKKWCDGKTGFPFVDAAMICMNKTGYMHNRLRMIVAMFLTKDMMIDWRLGEKYFATKLVDYDPASNSGGWQWAGSIGADSQPYFRIFNPWTQSIKFDKDCVFIKKWIPILINVPNKSIHQWYKDHKLFNIGYPDPILDHAVESKKSISYFT